MQTAQHDGPQVMTNLDDLRRLRDALGRAGFTEAGIISALGASEFPHFRDEDRPGLLERTGGGTALETLIRLFLVGAPVPEAAARAALGRPSLLACLLAGWLQFDGECVAATLCLRPYDGLLMASDFPPRGRARVPADFVLGIGAGTRTLAQLTVRRRAHMALDLGSGSGLHAFLAARHSDRVVAVDKNPRAVAFAELNRRLNGLDNVACREGDMFEPARGERFDLVVSCPPFVISPASRFIYRDSGMRVDGICRKMVREAPSMLREGGTCQLMANWAHPAGDEWQDRLAGWFEGSGCDAWVMRFFTHDVETYAREWIGSTERLAPAAFARRFDQWMRYYEREGIEAIGGGLITMRRASGRPNWFRADDAPPRLVGPGGEDIARALERQDYLRGLPSEDSLLSRRLRLAPQVAVDGLFHTAPSGQAVPVLQLCRTQGLAYSATLDAGTAELVARCDGTRPVRELLAEVADSPGLRNNIIRPAEFRQLVERGFLVPV